MRRPRCDLKSMVGVSQGDRTVIGYHGQKRWVVRCYCGVYSVAAGADLRRRPPKDNPIGTCRHPEGTTIRFFRQVRFVGDCWEWTGCVGDSGYGPGNGYGQFGCYGKTSVRAHRFSYERIVGPIPEGMELDHKCRNRRCVNPGHLEPVTHMENIHRGNMISIVKVRGYKV